MKYKKELIAAIEAGKIARDIVLNVYHGEFDVEIKDDHSPVTIADKMADQAIRDYLGPLFPNYAFLTEEGADDLARLTTDYVWIIDPVDGTTNFAYGFTEYGTCIGLTNQEKILGGVIGLPNENEIYWAERNSGAWCGKNKLKVSDLTNLIHPHPSLSETLYESALHFYGCNAHQHKK